MLEMSLDPYGSWGSIMGISGPLGGSRDPDSKEYLKATLRSAEEFLNGLKEQPKHLGIVLSVQGNRMIISQGQNTLDVRSYKGAKSGNRVTLHPQTVQVIELFPDDRPSGILARVIGSMEISPRWMSSGSLERRRFHPDLFSASEIAPSSTPTHPGSSRHSDHQNRSM